ncbi:beta-phosphoglucomutase [Thermanaeromonas toyohensis ToBE]|uniref:Beta-phosphoglucomutase n=1 Tax=Thermanaeromonas toyohensis ToBE TaxID=698762 RepID=A0A1W1W1H9_9FIRM|nr:beta-phosphoglucomutase [Thermanaeromonas toyohensis]SMB99426.1 beta-phosphoglucomutase [Thermanaeromonas toyohensis ToBE]
MLRRKGAIFDLDGVITDTAKYHYLAWKRLASELGLYFDEKINERLKGIGRLESLEIILEENGQNFSHQEKEYYANRKNQYYVEMIKNITPKDILPGVTNLIATLKAWGVKLAVASASKNAPTVLKNLRIIEWFDHVVDAGRIKKGKPDPEIFLVAAQNIGVKPWECVGFEDSAAGIEALKRAGMLAVGIGDKEALKDADLVVKDLTFITPILELFF